jgi:hypothetical protein
MSDDHSSPRFRVADAEYISERLAPAVLGGGWCALAPQNSPRGSARRSVLGSATQEPGYAKKIPPEGVTAQAQVRIAPRHEEQQGTLLVI